MFHSRRCALLELAKHRMRTNINRNLPQVLSANVCYILEPAQGARTYVVSKILYQAAGGPPYRNSRSLHLGCKT